MDNGLNAGDLGDEDVEANALLGGFLRNLDW
jgi:hypothetical protein